MEGMLILGIGLEYLDAIYQTIQDSDFSQYTITGMKTLAVLFFLVNILKKYNEGVAEQGGYTWGLHPNELAKNFAVVLVVIFSTQVLDFFDGVLVAIETQYRDSAPALLPIQLHDFPVGEDVGTIEAAKKAMAVLYDFLTSPFYGMKLLAFSVGFVLWLTDLFIYPLFLAERFFLLGLMRAFFPLVISMAVFEKFRDMAYNFFKLYAAVYMIAPAFFLVNVFINLVYEELNTNFWENLFGTSLGSHFFSSWIEVGTLGFIIILKFKLYRRAISFTMRLFAGG
ncbi:hypothetical protein [Sinomicrobium soli]|uniref:hypothetical protein n=1 Tax=Sinomicrobium sp. N-1-3-6 TaxID=2219864 RepID=UPI000DCEEDA1|nr:hypothetical protein [Sinomicrobium sp. N-1-3-6]RAV29226.1 hypothetical protein DN748_09925 [Sinomicrobium sp. N-1-3-6]